MRGNFGKTTRSTNWTLQHQVLKCTVCTAAKSTPWKSMYSHIEYNRSFVLLEIFMMLNLIYLYINVEFLWFVMLRTVEETLVSLHRLYYKPGTTIQGYPQLIFGDGDGTVNMRSLGACAHWQSGQKQKIYHQGFPGVDHTNILRNPDVLAYINATLKVW